MVKKEWIEKGYVDEPVDEALDLKAEIRKLCIEAVVYAETAAKHSIEHVDEYDFNEKVPAWNNNGAGTRRLSDLSYSAWPGRGPGA